MGFNETFCGRKAESSSSCFRRKERGEDLLANVGRYSWPGIYKSNLARNVTRTDRNADPAFPAHGLCTVHNQVLKHDLQQFGVRDDWSRCLPST